MRDCAAPSNIIATDLRALTVQPIRDFPDGL
jgi:hypothetical protein